MKADTSKGTAYHVAVKVEGAAGVAGVGTSDPPLQVDPGIIAPRTRRRATPQTSERTSARTRRPRALLLDGDGTSAAESCALSTP